MPYHIFTSEKPLYAQKNHKNSKKLYFCYDTELNK